MQVISYVVADAVVATPLIVHGTVSTPFIIPMIFEIQSKTAADGHKYVTIDPVTQKVTFNPVVV